MKLKGYIYVIFSGLFLIAGGLLIALQWGNPAEFSLYGKNMKANMALLMLISAGIGLLTPWLIRMFFHGAKALRTTEKPK